MVTQAKSLNQNKKSSSIATFHFIISFWILSGYGFSCQTNIEEAQEGYKDILGYWKSYRADIIKEKPGLIKVAINSHGKLVQEIIYDSSPQCKILINDDDISYNDGHLKFWGEEFKGEMSEDKNSIMLEYGSQFGNTIPFIWERIHDQKAIKFLDSLKASQGGKYDYRKPVKIDDGWECANLENVNINKDKIFECINRIRDGKYKDVHSLLIIKDNQLVFEEYFGAEGKINGPFINKIYRDRIHHQSSVTKTFTSAVFGVAVDKGYIKDVNEPVYNYFPEYSQFRDEKKDNILIKHILTMTAGLKWDENAYSTSDPRGDLYQWARSENLLEFYLKRPVVAEPGDMFSYSCACTMLLGEIVKRTTGSYIDDFAARTLFKDLGISNYSWLNGDTLISIHTGGLSVRPRDMAKLGQLFLNNGKWDGKQIISENWVKESIRGHKNLRKRLFSAKKSYGYQWWQRTFKIINRNIESFYAIGGGGQFILAIPEYNMVVVSTAGNFDNSWSERFYSMLRNYILPAILISN